ncbi:50S ribosomal protein L6 [Candidatus Woesebacteria bacterium]|nr:50S ribosomal protein L6 [Candidatus Woesebacteria bacterium]
MSRIGKKAITLPANVTVTVNPTAAVVKGPKGELTVPLFSTITVAVADGEIVVTRSNDEKPVKALHGLVRSLLQNNIIGVTEGYSKTLKLIGTGYRAQAKGKGLTLALGFSHPVDFEAVDGITFTLKGTDTILVEGADKHLVGQVSANIRKIRPPEPYQGKGIRYSDEVVRRKQGKAAA